MEVGHLVTGLVYHGSPSTGLRVIKPHSSTHREKWVYACPDPVMAALFVSTTGGDLICQVGRDPETGLPYICERFAGAFQHQYHDHTGSLYTLPGHTFETGMTGWEEEVVSPVEVVPITETIIANIRAHLLQLVSGGQLIVAYFPHRIDDIPPDDEDLVEKAASWVKTFDLSVLEAVRTYHPGLVDRVLRRLAGT
jgi:hypothetical protein